MQLFVGRYIDWIPKNFKRPKTNHRELSALDSLSWQQRLCTSPWAPDNPKINIFFLVAIMELANSLTQPFAFSLKSCIMISIPENCLRLLRSLSLEKVCRVWAVVTIGMSISFFLYNLNSGCISFQHFVLYLLYFVIFWNFVSYFSSNPMFNSSHITVYSPSSDSVKNKKGH